MTPTSKPLPARLTVEHDRTTGGVTFLLDGHGWIWCSAHDELRVRKMIFGPEGFASVLAKAEP